jgi:hypothetical protein
MIWPTLSPSASRAKAAASGAVGRQDRRTWFQDQQLDVLTLVRRPRVQEGDLGDIADLKQPGSIGRIPKKSRHLSFDLG